MDTGHSIESIQIENVITTVTALLDTVVTPTQPVVDGELPFSGHRFAGILPPVAEAPTYIIRKHSRVVFPLDDYLRDQIITPAQAEFFRRVLAARKNLILSGGTASGKTTFANALLHELSQGTDATERFIILEDTRELKCTAPNTVKLHTADVATLTFLVSKTMRLRPDRIIIGEVRGGEALALLKAWNTGHSGGLATIHANSASAALTRLDMLVQEAGVPPQPTLVSETVDYVAHMTKTPTGRKIHDIVRVISASPDGYHLEPVTTRHFRRRGPMMDSHYLLMTRLSRLPRTAMVTALSWCSSLTQHVDSLLSSSTTHLMLSLAPLNGGIFGCLFLSARGLRIVCRLRARSGRC